MGAHSNPVTTGQSWKQSRCPCLFELFVDVGIYRDELFLKLLSLFPISFATFYVYFHVSQSVLFFFFPFLIVSDPFFHWRSSSVEPLC